MKRVILAVVIFFIGSGISLAASETNEEAKITIKIATIAPKRTTMAKIIKDFRTEVREKTNNEVDFKVYWGGVQGDEIDVLRKVRLKQLHGGAFTGRGLGQIVPEVRVTELPYAFRNSEEVAYVRSKLKDTMDKKFEEKGYVVLAWHDIGFVYAFSKVPITSVEVLKKQKCWVWGDDVLSHEVYNVIGITPVPLSITDVLTSLTANLIDNASVTPFGAVAFRWYHKFNYMTDFPIVNVVGALIVTKETWDKISDESQKKIKEIAKVHFDTLTKSAIKADRDSIEVLKKEGIIVAHAGEGSEIDINWRLNVGKQVRENLVGKLYSRELLDRTLSLLDEYRRVHPDSSYVRIE
jgi:TRAP-type C4-dicarboxylate transport system substrate-binding protein